MPTGYTAFIEDGEITTGKEFLLLCSRAFGVAVDIKEEPLNIPTPMKFEPNTYHKERLDEALKELNKIVDMTFEDAYEEMKMAFDSEKQRNLENARKSIRKNETYDRIRKEVENWNPPTSEHIGIKNFALEQIDKSKDSQKYIDEYLKWENKEFYGSKKTVDEYIREKLRSCNWNIDYHSKSWDEEVRRAADKTKFMKEFVLSLENM